LLRIEKVGSASKFRPCVWKVEKHAITTDAGTDVTMVSDGNTRSAMSANTGITLQEVRENCLEKIVELLTKKDAIASSEYFRGIFERDAQIRIVLSSIKSFLETDGERRNHILLYGLPACAKTQILNAITKLVSESAVVRLDGTSTTPAGIYKTYFEDFNDIAEPPFVILEEAGRKRRKKVCAFGWVRLMIGANFARLTIVNKSNATLKFFAMATANDKPEFDRLMGGTDNKPGALSSRFAHQIECPRPNEKILRLILERDILTKGGKLAWD